MENILLNEEGSGEVNYHDNKNIKLRKRGRTKKIEPTPEVLTPTPQPTQTPQLTEKEIWINWVKENRIEFMNSGKKSNEFITNVYKAYNSIYNTNKSRGKCGICDWNIILELKRKFF